MKDSENGLEKRNNLNTKILPPLFMLVAGLISLIISIAMGYEMKKLLTILFVSMLIFTIIGTIVKVIVDSFDMHVDYDDYLGEDLGDIKEK